MRKFEIKTTKSNRYQVRHYASCIGEVQEDNKRIIVEITEDAWNVICCNPKSFLAGFWRNIQRYSQSIKTIK